MANIEIGGRLHSTATGNVVTGANEVLDDTRNKKQSVINAEVDEAIGDDNTAGTIKGRIKTAEGKLDTLNGDSSTSGSVAKAVADAKSEVIGDAASDYNTLGKLEDKIQAEASARESAVSIEAQARQDAITAETNRATTRENQIYDLVHTPEQHYVTVATYADLANIASPSDDTVYRVSSYNGKTSQVDNTVYSEYGYDGTNFVFLCVKSQIDEVYDISAHHSNNTYVDLAAALDGGNNIPQELRRGGMSVKFVQSSDNKYVQYRYMGTATTGSPNPFLDTANWQGVATELIAGSRDLVESRCVYQSQQLVTEKYLRKSDYCAPENYIKSNIELISGGYYDYTADPVSYAELSGIACTKVNVISGDMFRLQCNVAYSRLAAVIFLDENDNMIGYLYGDNTPTIVSVDTGIISAPPKCVSIAFNAYILDGSTPQLTKYETPKVLTEKDTTDIVVEIVNPNNDREISSVSVDSGHYYNGDTLEYKENASFSGATANIKQTDKVSFHGSVRYSAIYGIIFADDEGTIISRMGHSGNETLDYDSGIVDVPNGATKVYFNALGSTFDARIYSLPDVLNSINIEEYLGGIPIKTKYCNPYHYVFGISQVSDIENSGFDSNFESSIANAFLIHSKYFKSYRRKHEWKVVLSASSVVSFGTTPRTSEIVTQSRMSKAKVDVANNNLVIYKETDTVLTTVPLSNFVNGEEYILRASLFDYELKFEVIRFATLQVCATYTHTSTPTTSQAGKLLGFPFIQLNNGNIAVKQYDSYLMYKPDIVFVGDSITECGYRQNTYASMFITNNMNNNGCIIAQGGANIDVLGLSLDSEIIHMKPKYLSLLAGTNNTITENNIVRWKNFCDENDIIFIINTIPVSQNAELYPWTDKNNTILAAGILGSRFDIATALHNNPADGANVELFGDDVHPNAAGQEAMYHRFLNDVILV